MISSPLIVQSLHSSDELTEYIKGYVQNDSSEAAQRRLRKLTTSSNYHLEQIRSAYCDGSQLGSYWVDERLLRVGVARLATSCIGGIFTRHEACKQDVVTALMDDAVAYAQFHDYPLLLLDGVPQSYYHYGYCDVHDLSEQYIDRRAILAMPKSSYTVRHFVLDDAASLLALYGRHFGPYIGSFERSLEQQIYWMQNLEPERLLLAIDAEGQARGYIFLFGTQVQELAVDDWPATVALLQYHVRLVEDQEGSNAPVAFRYNMPPTSSVRRWIVENLDVHTSMLQADFRGALSSFGFYHDLQTGAWNEQEAGWAMYEKTFHHRRAGWIARLVSLPALTRAMLPEWQARWQRSLAQWSGDVSLVVGEETFTLRLTGADLQLLSKSSASGEVLSLTPQAFTQVVFGYRHIASVVQQREQPLPNDLSTVLNILFPTRPTWIPISDWF